jgi:hypothetical protein
MTEGNTFKVNDRRFSTLQAAQRYANDHHEDDIEEYEMIGGKEQYLKTHSIVEALSLSKPNDVLTNCVTFCNTAGRESPADAMGHTFRRDE